MAQQVKNKRKLYKYKVIMNYHYVGYGFRIFIVWAYTSNNAIVLIANKLNLLVSEINLIGNIYIYKYPIYSFFARLFNKVPKKPICI